MKALILDGEVVEIAQNEFPVHASLKWVDCDDTVKEGYTYEDGEFIAPPEPQVDRAAQIKRELDDIDKQTIRPLRAKIAGTETQEDTDKLADLETQAQALRDELANL